MDETIDMLRPGRWFTTMDLVAGFWQAPLHQTDREKTAFITRDGLFEYKVLPMGLSNAPATFQRMMQLVLSGLLMEFALCYLDDIIIFSTTEWDHLFDLSKVLQRLREGNLKIKGEKCTFARNEIHFLGHVITPWGIRPDPAKITAIQKCLIPRSITETKSFLGIAAFYRMFIEGFAFIAAPLYNLTNKTSSQARFDKNWDDAEQQAFETLKYELAHAPMLAYPNPNKDFILYTDASEFALGYILTQTDDEDKKERVVYFGSRKMSPPERNYSVTEKECLAVEAAFKQFRHYLHGNHTTVYTDHQPLLAILNKRRNLAGQSTRLFRMAYTLSEYEYSIVYKKGKLHLNADAMTRPPFITDDPEPSAVGRAAVVRSHDTPEGTSNWIIIREPDPPDVTSPTTQTNLEPPQNTPVRTILTHPPLPIEPPPDDSPTSSTTTLLQESDPESDSPPSLFPIPIDWDTPSNQLWGPFLAADGSNNLPLLSATPDADWKPQDLLPSVRRILDKEPFHALREFVFSRKVLEYTPSIPFFSSAPDTGYMSNFALCQLVIDGQRFASVEHFLYTNKAVMCGHPHIATRILHARTAASAKRLGRSIEWRGTQASWVQWAINILYVGNVAKYRQNPHLLGWLLETGNSRLVEANPHQSIWGAGLPYTEYLNIQDPAKWKPGCFNIFGDLLTLIRDHFKEKIRLCPQIDDWESDDDSSDPEHDFTIPPPKRPSPPRERHAAGNVTTTPSTISPLMPPAIMPGLSTSTQEAIALKNTTEPPSSQNGAVLPYHPPTPIPNPTKEKLEPTQLPTVATMSQTPYREHVIHMIQEEDPTPPSPSDPGVTRTTSLSQPRAPEIIMSQDIRETDAENVHSPIIQPTTQHRRTQPPIIPRQLPTTDSDDSTEDDDASPSHRT